MSARQRAIISMTARVIAIVAVPSVFLAGCMSFNPRSLSLMEAALKASNPQLTIESSTTFGLGALTLDLIDFAFVHDRSIDVSSISKIEVATYELKGELALEDFKVPQAAVSDARCQRREVIVRTREADEQSQIAVCLRNEEVVGLEIFTVEPDEITVVNARGDFAKLVQSLVTANTRMPRDKENNKRNQVSASAPVTGAMVANHQITE